MGKNDLVARIGGDTKGFDKAMMGVRRGLNSVSRIAAPMIAVVTGVAASFALIAKQTGDMGDSIDKTAKRLGFGVKELQEWRLAAKIAGVDVRTFDMAMQRMSRRVAEAAVDTGEAKDAIKQLGISAKDIVKLRADQQFEKMATALAGVENKSERLRLAFKLFDSEGVRVVQMVSNGVEGLKDLRSEASRLGVIFTDRQVANAVKFKDATTRVAEVIKLSLGRLVIETFPELATSLDNAAFKMAEITRGSDFGRIVVDVKGIVTEINKMITSLTNADGILGLIRMSLTGINAAASMVNEGALGDMARITGGGGGFTQTTAGAVAMGSVVSGGLSGALGRGVVDEGLGRIAAGQDRLQPVAEAIVEILNRLSGD